MKYFFYFLSSIVYLYAYSYNDVLNDYEHKRYEKVCNDGAEFYMKNEKNENILVIIGDACAKTDAINQLGYIVKSLNSTQAYRESGSYFSTLILQKKLIYQFMCDGNDLKGLKLPLTDHLLSEIFHHLSQGNYEIVAKETKEVRIKTETKYYFLWLSKDIPAKLYIDEYRNNELIKRHWYR